MIRYLAVASLVMLLPSGQGAFAQTLDEGLDLTTDAKTPEAKKKDGGSIASKPAPAVEDKHVQKKDEGPAVERDVTQDDRVKSVQRKLYLKRGRFELAPISSSTSTTPTTPSLAQRFARPSTQPTRWPFRPASR